MESVRTRILTFRSSLEELAPVRAEISLFIGSGAEGTDKSRIILSLDEALSNVIRHGYGGRDDGEIRLEMKSLNGRFEFVLSDKAPLYNPLEKPYIEKEPGEDACGGLGVGVYRKFMNVSYQTDEQGGNRLILVWEKLNETPSAAD